jgi:hypothetical protein
MSNNTKLLYLCLKAQTTAKSSEQGYSMAMVSIITIILFSLMVAATILSNMAKARTNAFVDSNSAFYVAETGLNRRAAEISDILKNSTVRTVAGSPTRIDDCLSTGIAAGGLGVSARSGTNDLECVNYRFQSSNNIARSASGKDIVLDSGNQDKNTYVSYTLVRDSTILGATGLPPYAVIPAGEPFEGLNATSFTYLVSSAGRKPVALPNTSGAATATAAKDSSNNVTLQMTFVNRVVPLFQFGIFYNGDLELNSSSNMQINGWVHSNANMYLQPAAFSGGTPTTTFTNNVSAVGSIYNRVDAWTDSADNALSPTTTTGTTRLQLGTTAAFANIPTYSGSTTPLSGTEISSINTALSRPGWLRDGLAGATRLKVPSPSFGRKRNYLDNTIGESFARADIRLEMVPDRDVVLTGGTTSNVGGKAATPWIRNRAIIPFNFTAIRTTGAGTCTTATPTAGSDPAATYVDPRRENLSTLRCNIFTKGQLQSLRQPVMVLTALNATPARTGISAATIATQEATALGGSPVAIPARLTAVSGLPIATRTAIARALQVAIVSHPTPVPLDNFNDAFGGASFGAGSPLVLVKTTFQNLLSPSGTPIAGLTGTDIGNLINSSPNEIAALVGGWFLPAPIQRIEPTNPASVTDAANNRRGGGFYDSREQRWMATLQTNIASLSVWNRDGLYVEDTNNAALTVAYNPKPTDIAATFALGLGANFTNGLAFDRVTVFTNAGGEIYPGGSLQSLGLGTRDTTEGGLVFHATVNDDLNGDGTIDTNDIRKDTASYITVINTSGASVNVDYVRTYPNETVSRRSQFAFAFSGGNYLPSAMTLYSDQAVYVQGNFNNNATNPATNNFSRTIEDANRLPAAIVADTITVLSNQCVNGANPLAVPSGQLTCAYPPTSGAFNNVTSALSINAAFLSNTQVSVGNLGVGRGYPAAPSTYSGGANNYIRLLENWQNGGTPYALNYTGSLVSLSQPNENSGLYRAGGFGGGPLPTYYDVPFRVITFDNNFQDNTRLPPLTPKSSYVLQRSFSRTY